MQINSRGGHDDGDVVEAELGQRKLPETGL